MKCSQPHFIPPALVFLLAAGACVCLQVHLSEHPCVHRFPRYRGLVGPSQSPFYRLHTCSSPCTHTCAHVCALGEPPVLIPPPVCSITAMTFIAIFISAFVILPTFCCQRAARFIGCNKGCRFKSSRRPLSPFDAFEEPAIC